MKEILMTEDRNWVVSYGLKNHGKWDSMFFEDRAVAEAFLHSVDGEMVDLNLSDMIDYFAKFRPSYRFEISGETRGVSGNLYNFHAVSDNPRDPTVHADTVRALLRYFIDMNDLEEVYFANRIGFIS